jgi:uncharacterized lipoprotein YddW (UPF0748 family)
MKHILSTFTAPVFLTALLVLTSCSTTTVSPTKTPARATPTTPSQTTLPPAQTGANEIRAIWVSDTTKLDWDTATSALQRGGFNTMYVNFASGGAALYPRSAVLPSVVTRDDITRGITLAHQRGLAVHAKIIASYMFKVPTAFQQQLTLANRVERGPDGKPVLQTGQAWLCPSQKQNRDLVANAVREILTRYPVDGVQFDYIRFCEQPSCYCSRCRHEFEQTIGKPVRRWPADATAGGVLASRFNEWKQTVITDWMRQLSDECRRARPGVVITAAVFPDLARAKEEKAQDWKLWLDRRWLDYVCTMTYTAPPDEFEKRVRLQRATIPGDKLIVGIGSWKLKQFSELVAQIGAVRRNGAAGLALFSYDDSAARNFLPNLGPQATPPGK